MAYAILRTAKLKEIGHIAGSLAHTFRTRETPNADQARAHLNENSGPETPEAILNAIKERLPEKVRKNGVRCIEYFIGGSPEHFQTSDGAAYFEDAKRWLIERHGAENVISTHVHRDETTPHMVAYVVPITPDGKLSARHFLGGPDAMRELQTDFAERVGKRHGLERGVEGSKAKHQTIAEYYQRANLAEVATRKIDFPKEREKKGFVGKESDAEFSERVARDVMHQMSSNYVKAQEIPALQKRLKETEQTNKALIWQRDEALKTAAQATKKAAALANHAIAQEREKAAALVAEANRSAAPWHQLLQTIPQSERAGVFEAVKEAVRDIAAKAREKVVGIFTGFVVDPERGYGDHVAKIVINEGQPNEKWKHLTLQASEALREQGVKFRDKIEATPFGAKILARRHEHEQVAEHLKPRDQGRGGISR